MTKKPLLPASALFLLLASACSEDTTAPRDGGIYEEDPKNDAGGDGDGDQAGDGGPGQVGDSTKLGDNVAGKACTSDMDCAGGGARCATSVGGIMGLAATSTPGGYCTRDCSSNDDCGAGGVCSSSLLGSGSCVAACTSNADCTREGYHCAEGVDLFVLQLPASCLPRPETDKLADGVVGKPCGNDSACGTGFCADSVGEVSAFGQTLPGRDAPGGYCSGSCLEDSECGKGGVCVAPVPNQPGRCYLECGSACTRDDYHCGALFEFGGGGGGGFAGGGGFENPNLCVPKPPVEPDAGSPDSGSDEPDSGSDEPDSGSDEPDSGTDEPDSGADDAGTEPN